MRLVERAGRVVYPLTRLVRRVLRNMRTQIIMTSAMAVLAISFSCLFLSGNNPASPWFWIALALFLTAILSWNEALDRLKKEEAKAEQTKAKKEWQMDTLISEIRGLRQDLNNRDSDGEVKQEP